ncbi:T9SS type A sorting domain-containing protein [bacterium]|nr:T9SS type A sorting domain-containing protein [bacterium]
MRKVIILILLCFVTYSNGSAYEYEILRLDASHFPEMHLFLRVTEDGRFVDSLWREDFDITEILGYEPNFNVTRLLDTCEAEIILCIDSSGSMCPPIVDLIDYLPDFATCLTDHGINPFYRLITFHLEVSEDSTVFDDVDTLVTRLRDIRCAGGGVYPENTIDAMERACNISNPELNTIIHVLTDSDGFYERGCGAAYCDLTRYEIIDTLLVYEGILFSCAGVGESSDYFYGDTAGFAYQTGGKNRTIHHIDSSLADIEYIFSEGCGGYYILNWVVEDDTLIGSGDIRHLHIECPTTTLDTFYAVPSTGIMEAGIQKPENFTISAYPNPFNSFCRVEAPGNASIEIFDINGRIVYDLAGDWRTSNHSSFTWQPLLSAPSGIYMVKVSTNSGSVATKKIVYLK